MEARCQTPSGLDHLVLYVDDLERSHVFWTERLGFRHVGTSRRGAPGDCPAHRFYSGMRDGALAHHTAALVQRTRDAEARLSKQIDHIAIGYADETSWREQIAFLESVGVQPRNKVLRGTIYSAQITDSDGYVIELACALDRSLWENDIDAALNKSPVAVREGWVDTV